MSNPYELSDDMPVYVISVAAQLSDMHPQTLRAHDRFRPPRPGITGPEPGPGAALLDAGHPGAARDPAAVQGGREPQWHQDAPGPAPGARTGAQARRRTARRGRPAAGGARISPRCGGPAGRAAS